MLQILPSAYFAETDETVNKKLKSAHKVGLKPIVCVGESLKEREQGIAKKLFKNASEKFVKKIINNLIKENKYDSYYCNK